jgi:hypothetical protein
MRPSDIYWHVYRREQIKASVRGSLICLVEIPRLAGEPVVRHVFDPRGIRYPKGNRHLKEILRRRAHGLGFHGISEDAVFDLLLTDPPILKQDTNLFAYNRGVIGNTRRSFLLDPDWDCPALPPFAARLLAGKVFPSGHLHPHAG